MSHDGTSPALPQSIPAAGHQFVPLALATRADIEAFAVAAEGLARAGTEKYALATRRLAGNRAALQYFPSNARADMTLKRALAQRGRGESTTSEETKANLELACKVLRGAMDRCEADISVMNGFAIAGRVALELFRPGDPPGLTYGQAYGRAQRERGTPPAVTVAAPQVHVAAPSVTVEAPDRPKTITARKEQDGTLVATIRPSA